MSLSEPWSIELTRIDGTPERLQQYRGKVLLVVNLASQCGFTPQYSGLQSLHSRFGDRGLGVLGFPCNQFGGQEPGDAATIMGFCESRYAVRFPIFAKTEVNGATAHPLFQWLKRTAPGLLGTEGIKWNFTKFLVSRDASEIKRYAPTDSPESMTGEVVRMLALRG